VTRRALTVAALLALLSCRGEGQAPAVAPDAAAQAAAPAVPVAVSAADVTNAPIGAAAHPTLKPMPRKPIFVGGCRDACREPVSAFGAFLAALASDPEGRALVPFLNTAELVVNGERHGDGWAELWKRGQWPERQADVDAFAHDFAGWVRALDDPGALDHARAHGVKVLKDESERAEIAWHHPGVTGDMTSPDWRFILKPRGLEWLIVEIDQYTRGE
jgi:hypothetical protein